MAFLPGLDHLQSMTGFSDAQINWIQTCQILVFIFELCVFGWLFYNVWTILYK